MSAHSSFAEAARARKVAALVEHLDAGVQKLGKHPHRDAAEIAHTLKNKINQLGWFAHARCAGQRKPSPTTQAEVIATYERRAAHLAMTEPVSAAWQRFAASERPKASVVS